MTHNFRFVAAVAVLVALVLSVPVQAQTPAIEALQTRAEQGDAEAQVSLGCMYQDGIGVPRDAAEAVRWFRLATDQGHADAQATIETWRVDYNAVRPHSALHGQTPWQFARASTEARGPRPARSNEARNREGLSLSV